MKMKTKRSWAHAYVCVSYQHHNRTTTSRSVGRSVDRYMYASTVCFSFPRALCREIILLPTYSTYQVAGRFKKLFQVLLAIGGGLLSFGRSIYYITTTTAAAAKQKQV